ncbi:hypothetical protein [Mycolicibacterium monacense]|nr:hypothetical protein [Mycolicibacterium monacense]
MTVTDIPPGGASFKDKDGYFITEDGSVAWETHLVWPTDEDDE